MKDTLDKFQVDTVRCKCIEYMVAQVPCTRLRNRMYEQLQDKLWDACHMVYNQIQSEL